MRKAEDKNIIEIKEETQIGEYILEPGDKIKIYEQYDPMDNVDIRNAVNQEVSMVLETVLYDFKEGDRLSDISEMAEERAMEIDETSVVDLSLERMVDLCWYAEEEGVAQPPSSWENLEREIEVTSTVGLSLLVKENVMEEIEKLENVMDQYGIDESDAKLYNSDEFGMFPPESVDDITVSREVVGEVYRYRNIEGDVNVDVYKVNVGTGNVYIADYGVED